MNKKKTNKTKIKDKIESLEKQSQIIRSELEEELEMTKERVINIGKIALGAGSGLLFSALVLKGLIGNKSKKSDSFVKYGSKRVYQRFINQMMSELSFQATKFLLGIAKDKLSSQTILKENTEDDDSDITG